jgi:hypothetical protein
MNFILGSGIIGYLACKILGPNWGLIPFKRSRYFTFDIPYSDNYIKHDAEIDDFIKSMYPNNPVLFCKCPFSYQGILMYQELPMCMQPYLNKIYDQDIPDLASSLVKTSYTTYQATAKELHDRLYDEMLSRVNNGKNTYGDIISIDVKQHIIKTTIGSFEYEKIVSTIPLNALNKMCGLYGDLHARDVCYYSINSTAIDLEGADQAYVADLNINFFKVQKLSKDVYIFWTFDVIEQPFNYFGSILSYKIDIIEARRIEDVIPIGNPPDLKMHEKCSIYCVGSNAQWDDFMDVAACIKRLLRLSKQF